MQKKKFYYCKRKWLKKVALWDSSYFSVAEDSTYSLLKQETVLSSAGSHDMTQNDLPQWRVRESLVQSHVSIITRAMHSASLIVPVSFLKCLFSQGLLRSIPSPVPLPLLKSVPRLSYMILHEFANEYIEETAPWKEGVIYSHSFSGRIKSKNNTAEGAA